MSKAIITEKHLHDIADAIIAKGGAIAPMTPAQMPAAIAAIPSGGEWVIQPWIMDASEPTKLDGWIHLWFHFDDDAFAYAYFTGQFISNGHTFTVDWGDGTVETIAASTTYTSRALSHTYSANGEYRIDITGYDSVKLANNILGNAVAGQSIRQIQIGNFDEDTGITANFYAYGARAINWSGDIKTIGSNVFSDCTYLRSIGNLENCNSILNNVFLRCASLKHVSLPLCKSVGGSIFVDCKSLIDVDLSSCESFGTSVFNGCSSLKSVDLSSLTSFTGSMFAGCDSLELIKLGNHTSEEVVSFPGFNNIPNRSTCIVRCADGDFYRSGSTLVPIS